MYSLTLIVYLALVARNLESSFYADKFVRPTSSIWYVGLTCFWVGLGMGLVVSPSLIAAQSAYPRGVRGVITGTSMFARSIGSAVGIAVFGAIVNAILLARLGPGDHADTASVPADALAPAVHAVFLGVGVSAVVLLIAIALIPGRVAEAAAEPTGPTGPTGPVEPT